MGHESLIQRRPSLSHPGGLKYFFSDIQSVTLNYHTPRHTNYNTWLALESISLFGVSISSIFIQAVTHPKDESTNSRYRAWLGDKTAESEKPRQRISNADRKVFANP